ncbi:MAG: class I SAM-dependent methyltransferase [Saprospiraceae bacterium]|nr:class I SAM-dependent methyltransferase [Saprospiraceae bacterium]
MGLYSKYVLPRLINSTCSVSTVSKQRAKIVPLAKGKVLEIGIGSGLNLPFYQKDQVKTIWGLEPQQELLAMAKTEGAKHDFPIHFIQASAEDIPLDNQQFDTIVITYTLCSIPKANLALAEMKRVLKPGGQVLFCEHGAAPDPEVLKWQNRINPLWKRVGGGCNLNRRIPALFQEAGFQIPNLHSMYIPGWRPACFNYWGNAVLK